MQQKGYIPDTASAITQYFSKADMPTQQETLGQIVVENPERWPQSQPQIPVY
jgi:hypothetical protein